MVHVGRAAAGLAVLLAGLVCGCRYQTALMPRSDVAMMNERWAADMLNRIARTEFVWRQRDMDADGALNFYVADLAFLEAQGGRRASPPFGIPEALVRADQGRFGDDAVPYHGYYYAAMTRNADGVPYVNTQRFEFGFVAWPAAYRDGGVRTLIVNQDGHVWAREHAGAPQMLWPEPDPMRRGWVRPPYPGWPPAFPAED
jgi:hypothetical protein